MFNKNKFLLTNYVFINKNEDKTVGNDPCDRIAVQKREAAYSFVE